MLFIEKYFIQSENISDKDVQKYYHAKSGSIAEKGIQEIFIKHCLHNIDYQKHIQEQFIKHKYYKEYAGGPFILDACTSNIIYEFKNYMFESTGTANEKLTEALIKYKCLLNNKFKNIIIILCAKFEIMFLTKSFYYIKNSNIINECFDNGIYIDFMSKIIDDFYLSQNDMTFVKWIGGKSKLLHIILEKISDKLQIFKKPMVYKEPFLGSGAVCIELLRMKPKNIIAYECSDLNENLIITFNQIKDNHEELIYLASVFQKYYNSLEANKKEVFYYDLREKYNQNKDIRDDNVLRKNLFEYISELDIDDFKEINDAKIHDAKIHDAKIHDAKIHDAKAFLAVMFIVLNKLCFRGMYRLNSNGLYNVPFGNYKSVSFINEKYIREISSLFNENNVSFIHRNYLDIEVNGNMFLYLDPPYFNTFDNYTSGGMNYDLFIEWLKKIDIYNFVLSNSYDFKEVVNEQFADSDFIVEEVKLHDRINSKSPNSIRREIIIY